MPRKYWQLAITYLPLFKKQNISQFWSGILIYICEKFKQLNHVRIVSADTVSLFQYGNGNYRKQKHLPNKKDQQMILVVFSFFNKVLCRSLKSPKEILLKLFTWILRGDLKDSSKGQVLRENSKKLGLIFFLAKKDRDDRAIDFRICFCRC